MDINQIKGLMAAGIDHATIAGLAVANGLPAIALEAGIPADVVTAAIVADTARRNEIVAAAIVADRRARAKTKAKTEDPPGKITIHKAWNAAWRAVIDTLCEADLLWDGREAPALVLPKDPVLPPDPQPEEEGGEIDPEITKAHEIQCAKIMADHKQATFMARERYAVGIISAIQHPEGSSRKGAHTIWEQADGSKIETARVRGSYGFAVGTHGSKPINLTIRVDANNPTRAKKSSN